MDRLVMSLIPVFLTGSIMAQTLVEKTDFEGWSNSYRVTNGELELIVVAEVGPRILSLRYREGRNLFRVFEQTRGRTGGEEWRNYGGHRLWHAPEDRVRTYVPDNSPVQVETISDGIRLSQPPEASTGIRKTMEISLDPRLPRVRVRHFLRNTGSWAVELAPWAITVMERGGFAVSPLPTRHHPDRLLPNRSLTLWPYTDMRDTRYLWGRDFVLVRQESGREPTKIGVFNDEGWLAYYLEPFLFVKRFRFVEGARYPDFDSTVEIYTNAEMLEVETLGPLTRLEPGGEVEHEEIWELFKLEGLDFTEEGIRKRVLPEIGDR